MKSDGMQLKRIFSKYNSFIVEEHLVYCRSTSFVVEEHLVCCRDHRELLTLNELFQGILARIYFCSEQCKYK